MKSKLDLNLLIVLILLDKHRQIKSVAKVLGKTESAVSKHLAKLREQLKDPLFVRVGNDFEPSLYMKKILPIISLGVETIDSISKCHYFDPLSYEEDIVIALPNIMQYWVGNNIVFDVIKTFPKAKVILVSWDEKSNVAMSNGDIDIGVHYFNSDLPKSIYQQGLGRMLPKVVTNLSLKGHSFKQLTELPFFWLTTNGASHKNPSILKALNKNEVYLKTVGEVDTVSCLLDILANSQSATILHCLNDTLEGFNITDLPNCNIEEQPLIVINYRLANRDTPLTQLLAKIIVKNFTK